MICIENIKGGVSCIQQEFSKCYLVLFLRAFSEIPAWLDTSRWKLAVSDFFPQLVLYHQFKFTLEVLYWPNVVLTLFSLTMRQVGESTAESPQNEFGPEVWVTSPWSLETQPAMSMKYTTEDMEVRADRGLRVRNTAGLQNREFLLFQEVWPFSLAFFLVSWKGCSYVIQQVGMMDMNCLAHNKCLTNKWQV